MSNTFYMAPIRGITNSTYRNIYSKHFLEYDIAIAPFIQTVNKDKFQTKIFKDLIKEKNNSSLNLVPQLLTKNAEDFIEFSKTLFSMGYNTINWNLGCPHIQVRKKGMGSALLSNSKEIINFLDKVIPAIPNKLSIKVRLGEEINSELLQLLPKLNDYSLKEIIIHPRTGIQIYNGSADIQEFEKTLSQTKHTIVYNGDISSLEKFRELQNKFPTINNWMIGRYGISNPFLLEEINNNKITGAEEKTKRFSQFYKELFESIQNDLNGPSHILSKMKEFWSYWAIDIINNKKLFKKISKVKTIDNYNDIINKSLM